MKLKTREIPLVQFKHALPEYLGPGGECYIEVDARAGGAINAAWSAAMEQLMLRARIMDRKIKDEPDNEAYVRTDHQNRLTVVKESFGIIYDTCVLSWRTNILDGDKPLETSRANFLELAEQRVPEIAAAFMALRKDIMAAGAAVVEDDKGIIKN